MKLFDADDGSSDEAEETSLKVNKSYAKRFETRKRIQETAQLKAKYGDEAEDDSDEESEDDEAKMLTPALDAQILTTIEKIRNKRPELYEAGSTFFEKSAADVKDEDDDEDDEDDEDEDEGDDDDDDDDDAPAASGSSSQTKRPVRLTDQLLENGLASDDEEEEAPSQARRGTLAYDAEQRALRESFLQAGDADDDEDEEGEEEGGLLQAKPKTAEQRAAERSEYKAMVSRHVYPPRAPATCTRHVHPPRVPAT